jgi:TonB family protein
MFKPLTYFAALCLPFWAGAAETNTITIRPEIITTWYPFVTLPRPLGQYDKPPLAISGSHFSYPAEMRRRGVVGDVVIVFRVDTNGCVLEPEVTSNVDPGLATEVLAHIKESKFRPAIVNGHPVDALMRAIVRFSLPNRATF